MVVNTPWQHYIIKNILNDNLLSEIISAANVLITNVKHSDTFIELVSSLDLGVPTTTVNSIVELADTFLDQYQQIISSFDNAILSPYGYVCKPQWGILKYTNESIHDDRYKDMSLNIRITGNGTSLYDDKLQLSTTINTANTGLLFCSNKNVTLHSINSSNAISVYLNIFFYKLDNWFDKDYVKDNIVTLNPKVLEWQKQMFAQGKLYRSPYNILDLL